MALIGHLDLLRLFDRAVRRSGLPVSFKGGFHPSPRIAIAQALPLGATSCSEIVDFELSELVDLDVFQEQLTRHLPADIPIYSVATVELKTPAAAQLLEKAEYLITVAAVTDVSQVDWRNWVEAIRAKCYMAGADF
jgi:radical SAM-linked protein